ncbi:glycosyltransferase family 2 protein [Candidatus Fermentibacterales bacterium]|nr:glycosyltransferase family 2 protein [Candidatus Fermentibacterales bacterium]
MTRTTGQEDTSRGELPSISVLIPAYNCSSTLRRTLESVRAQSLQPLETIVVDDASSDDTPGLAREHGARIIVNASNLGPAASRNIAAHSARGEILVFLDSDVVLPASMLHDFAMTMRNMPDVAAVQTLYSPVCPVPGLVTAYQNFYYHYSLARMRRTFVAVLATWCVALRKAVFEEAGGFNESIPEPTVEDEELGYALTDDGYRILLAKGLIVTHLASYGLGSFLRRRARMATAQAKSGLRSIRNRLLKRYANIRETGTHHSRWVVLSILLVMAAAAAVPGWAVSIAASGRVSWGGPLVSLGCLLLALVCHLPFLRSARKRLGARRALAFAVLVLADMAALGWGVARGTAQFVIAGKKY